MKKTILFLAMMILLMSSVTATEYMIKNNTIILGCDDCQSRDTLKFDFGEFNPRIIWGISYVIEQYRSDNPAEWWKVGMRETGHTEPSSSMNFDKGSWDLPYRVAYFKSYGDFDNGEGEVIRNTYGTPDQWRFTFPYKIEDSYTAVAQGRGCEMDIDYLGNHQTASLQVDADYTTIKTLYYVEGKVNYILFNEDGKKIGEWNNFNSLREDIKAVGIPLECFFVDVQVDLYKND